MTQMDEKALYHLDQVGIRIVKERELFSEKPIENPEAAIQVVADALQDYDRELFCVVNLQSDMRPINMNIVSMGVLNQALVHPREVLKSAILSNAASVLLFHNHPSQNVKPSREDIAVTDQLIQACALIGIPVTDHIIVGNAKISSIPEITANNSDAALIHEAALGKIAGEQIIKLMTLGLTEEEAEEQIISGFLK